MSSFGFSLATAALVGLLFAGTIGVDGVVAVWVALAWFDVPAAFIWAAVGITAAVMGWLTARLVLATWQIERRDLVDHPAG